MTVAAGVESVPIISFLASILQFGVGSWSFLYWPKTGRWIAIILGIAMLTWPISSIPWIIREGDIWGYAFYGVPIILSSLVVYAHLKSINDKERPGIWTRFLLTLFPCGLFVSYLIYLVSDVDKQWPIKNWVKYT